MKTAILISGETRIFWFACESIMENVIKQNNADVFCYLKRNSVTETKETLDEEEILKEYFGKNLKVIKFSDEQYDVEFNKLYSEFVNNVENNVVGKQRILEYYDYTNQKPIPDSLDQYFRLSKCTELLEEYEKENGKYDVVIRLRIDIPWINKMILQEKHKEGLWINYTILSHCVWFQEYFYFGNRNIVVDISKNMYKYLLNASPHLTLEGRDSCLIPEYQFGNYIADERIDYNKITNYNNCVKVCKVSLKEENVGRKYANEEKEIECYVHNFYDWDRNLVEINKITL